MRTATATNKKKAIISPTQRAEMRLSRRSEKEHVKAVEARESVVVEANRLLRGFGSDLTASFAKDGTLTLRSGRGAVVFQAQPSFDLMRSGTLLQGTMAHMRSFAMDDRLLLESRLTAAIHPTIAHSISSTAHDAPRIAALLLKHFWFLGNDDVRKTTLAVRKTTASLRKYAAMSAGEAALATSRGAEFSRQAVDVAPVIYAATDDAKLLGREIAAGHSPIKIAEREGAGKEVCRISASAVARLKGAALAQYERWLAAARASGVQLPSSGTHWRIILREMEVMALLRERLVEGFALWYLTDRIPRIVAGIKAEVVNVAALAVWASVTKGQRRGWKKSMQFDAAIVACMADTQGLPDISGIPNVQLNQEFQDWTDGRWSVTAAKSSHDLAAWGVQLSLCLSRPHFNARYTAAIQEGSAIIAAVYVRQAGKNTKLMSIVEFDALTGGIIQHRAISNSAPTAAACNAVERARNEGQQWN